MNKITSDYNKWSKFYRLVGARETLGWVSPDSGRQAGQEAPCGGDHKQKLAVQRGDSKGELVGSVRCGTSLARGCRFAPSEVAWVKSTTGSMHGGQGEREERDRPFQTGRWQV